MVELDPDMVDVAKRHLGQFHNCSFASPTQGPFSCFDDPRTTLVIEDAFLWFRRTFPAGGACGSSNPRAFDVIILDLLDPELIPDVEFARQL